MKRPEIKKEIDLKNLKEICQEYIDFVDSSEYYEDNDYSEYVFEQAMMTIFGQDVFDYVNKRQP